MRRHSAMESQSKNYPFPCSECHLGFTVEGDLEIHSAIHSKDGKHACKHCKKECASKNFKNI